MDKVTRQCPLTNHNLFEEKGEPKRYRTEVFPLTSLKPVLNWANVCSLNILRTVRQTMIRFSIELLVAEHGSDSSTNFTSFSAGL